MKNVFLILSVSLFLNFNSYAADTSSDDTDSVVSKFDEIESMLAGTYGIAPLARAIRTLRNIQNQYCNDDNYDDIICGIHDEIKQKIDDVLQSMRAPGEKRRRERAANQ
jgi:hypothetical protein